MKLYVNKPSPYGRKVLVVAHEKQLIEKLEVHPSDPWSDPAELLAATPIGKVPALVTDDGLLITESSTISEYFDEVGAGPKLIGPVRQGGDRFAVLARAALGQGLIDAAFAFVIERRRPPERQWPLWIERQRRAIDRTLPRIIPGEARFDLGDIALACALGYLDFRLPEIDWRAGQPALAAWFDGVSKRPSMAATKP